MPFPKHSINQLELFASAADISRPETSVRRRGPKDAPQGSVYDLSLFFRILNERYLWNHLSRPVLRWSRNRWRVVLGVCDFEARAITINRALDDARVPDIVVVSTLFHEMLHLYFGITEGKNGRQRLHPPEFKRAEKALPGYHEAEVWLDRHFPLRGRPAKKPRAETSVFLSLHRWCEAGNKPTEIGALPCGTTG